ncbi:enoyl-CoA hydratase/isomerase family protein [Microbacterium soli]|uniref:enoyl-CoA hydratase/isomerase family protein n=1 Tax=Microbacterium soli TaxID=446075 RepID=UPI0031CDC028
MTGRERAPRTSGATVIELDVRDDGVGVLTLNGPPLNLITREATRQLLEATARVAEDPRVRVLVITGAGDRAFCAGADVTEFADVRAEVVERKLRRENEAMTAIEGLPIPTIAAIGGVCLGGGAELALACDLRVADAGAVIGFPEVGLGVFPGSGGVFRLPRVVGLGRALDLLYSGRRISADEALRIGLVTEVTAPGAALQRALERGAALASGPALALRLIKSGARDSLTQTTAQAVDASLADSARVFTGPDIEEGLAAFAQKRPPRFTAPREIEARPAKEEGLS